jgi:glutathione S-transferase
MIIPGLSLTLLQTYQQALVVKARKESGVKYPTLYVTEAETAADAKKNKYQCTQRANQNTLETIPYILSLLLFLGESL